ncbi:MAG TPA: Spy/CpxP family protein refolding chaperone [Devosia sp.]|nr:Spy/CpxP family protein refolding chaperone [Devosia sp.]
MKRTTSMTIAALVVAVAAGAATAPVYAHDQGKRDFRGPGQDIQRQQDSRGGDWRQGDRRGPGQNDFGMRGGQRGGLLSLVCAPNGADQLEHTLLSISQRVSPTAEQQPLFDTLKSTALTAQTNFADTCAKIRPPVAAATATTPAPAATPPNLAERLKNRLAIETAQVQAMTTIVPAFDAFYGSLTDAQKLALEPQGRSRQGRMPGAPQTPAAPATPAQPQSNG